MKFDKTLPTLLIILLISLFLRVYDLSSESIWYDEAFSIKVAHLNLSQVVFFEDNLPPLHYIVLHLWVNLFGDSEFSVRFPSVMFGLLAIFMIYKVGTQIFNRDVSILSSLILGFSSFHIQYSQEARMYSLTVLLTLLSMYLFLKLIKERGFIFSIGYILSTSLLLYSHPYSLFIIVAQNIYILTLVIFSKDNCKISFKRWILIQVFLITFYIPWVYNLLSVIVKEHSGTWREVPTEWSIISTFITQSGSKLLLLLFFPLSLFSLVTFRKVGGNIDWKSFFLSIEQFSWKMYLSNTNEIYLLLVWLITPIILPFIISQFSLPIYHTKYTIVASLAFYLLIAKGIINIRKIYIKSIVIILIITFSLINVWDYYSRINKRQWKEVVNYIDANAKNEDLILFAGLPILSFEYYSGRTDIIKKSLSENYAVCTDDENMKELRKIVDDHNNIWLILADDAHQKGLTTQTIIESHHKSYHQKYKGMDLYRFEEK